MSDPDKINNFLLELVNAPDKKSLKYLDDFIENLSPDVFDKIKVNLVYLLGHIGSFEILDIRYQEFLIKEYFKSDRWIRNEILKAFELISQKNPLVNKIENILEYSLLDDYPPIKLSSLSLILKFENLPKKIALNLLKMHNLSDSNTIDLYSKVLKKYFNDAKEVFDLLNSEMTYYKLNKNTIRTLLLILFKSLLNLEHFRDLILNSDWDIKCKEIFLKEIYTFEKILLKKTY